MIGFLTLDALRARQSAKWRFFPEDVLPAFVAEMDFELAPPIREVLAHAVAIGDTGYALPDHRLSDAFAGFASRRFGWTPDPDQVTPVGDVVSGIVEVLRGLLPARSAVVICPPVYPPFYSATAEAGHEVVEVPLLCENLRYSLDLDGIDAAFAAGARAMLLCNPQNPSGEVLDPVSLTRLGEIAASRGALVVSDEIHAPLTAHPHRHTPFAQVGEAARESSVTLISASKAFNLPGLHCALMVTESDAMAARVRALPASISHGVGHLGVLATIAACNDGDAWLDELRVHLEANRKAVAAFVAERLPAVSHVPGQATYLAWLDVSGCDLGAAPAEVILEHGRVALGDGRRYGTGGADFVRLNFGTSAEILAEILARVEVAIGWPIARD